MRGKFGYFVFFAFVLFVFFFFLFITRTKAQPSPRPYLAYVSIPKTEGLEPLYATPGPDSPLDAAQPLNDPSYQQQRDPVVAAYKPLSISPYRYTQPGYIGGPEKTPLYLKEGPITPTYVHPLAAPERTPHESSYYVPAGEGPSTPKDPGYLEPQVPELSAPAPSYYPC